MAKQEGIIELSGSIGNITFQRTKNGFTAIRKSNLTAERVAKDAAFQRTRENNAEFGTAGRSAKLIKTAFRLLLQNVKDGTSTNRLFTVMMKAIKADNVSPRGQRNAASGNMALLKNFDFNNSATLSRTCNIAYSTAINRANGTISFTVPAFTPVKEIIWPEGASHYKIVMAAAELNFTDLLTVTDEKETAILPIDSNITVASTLLANLPLNSVLPIVVAAGVQFYQDVNGTYYPLKTGLYNPLSLVEVDKV